MRERFHLLTLRFRDEALETRYLGDTAESSLRLLRVGLAASIVTWVTGVAAFTQMPWVGANTALRVALLFIVPFLAAALLATRWLRSKGWQQLLGGVCNLVAGVTLVWFTTLEEVPARYALPLFLSVAVFAYFLLGLRTVTATLSVVCIGAYGVFVESQRLASYELVFQAVLFVNGGSATCVAAWLLERAKRNTFYEQVALEEAHTKLRHAQAQLVQSEKMAALGKLVAGVAHDVNTPLGAIVSTQQTLLTAVDKLSGRLEQHHPESTSDKRVSRSLSLIADGVATIGEGGRRIDEVVSRLRSFARLDEATVQDMDVQTCVDDVMAVMRHDVPDGVALTAEVDQVDTLRCHALEVNQLLMNLVANALDAVGHKGHITVRAREHDGDVHLEVEDDGVGISPEDIAQIFDPGFTTKGVGVGAGLGLAVAYQVARRHGGSIDAHSTPGEGSRFTVKLPRKGPPTY